MTPGLRRILWIAAACLVILIAAGVGASLMARTALGFAQKCRAGQCWGYELDQYAVSKRVVLTISGAWGLHLEYEFPKMRVERVSDDRWLGADRAIYLNLRLKPRSDPAAAGDPVQVLFDFHRGEMYVSSPLSLWRAPATSKDWLTEPEFRRVMAQIEP